MKFAWGSDTGGWYDSTTGNASRGKGGLNAVGSPTIRTWFEF
jgi:hypothetical protein